MDELERFEVTAKAFHIMTGHMAPGKDAPPTSYPAPHEVREAEWEAWNKQHGPCIKAMLRAFAYVFPSDE